MTPLEIEEKLLALPRSIWKINNEAIEEHEKYLKLEEEYDNAVAKAYLKLKAEKPEMTVRELDATSEVSCSTQRLDLIVQQAKYERKRNDAEGADKMLSAMQSVVKLRTAEMKGGLS